jgi:hypothetical protein
MLLPASVSGTRWWVRINPASEDRKRAFLARSRKVGEKRFRPKINSDTLRRSRGPSNRLLSRKWGCCDNLANLRFRGKPLRDGDIDR